MEDANKTTSFLILSHHIEVHVNVKTHAKILFVKLGGSFILKAIIDF